jgi:hypothetical protein
MNIISRGCLQKHCVRAGTITFQGCSISEAWGLIHICYLGETRENAKPDTNSLFTLTSHI